MFYIISDHPTQSLGPRLYELQGEQPCIEKDSQNRWEVAVFPTLDIAIQIYASLIQPLSAEPQQVKNYWYYILLNEIGYREFKLFRSKQRFRLLDLSKTSFELVHVNNLNYHVKGPFGGAVIKGKKRDFSTAFNFWASSVKKLIEDDLAINADLDGGTYNPISLETLDRLVAKACGSLSQYIEYADFVSAIEMDNRANSSGCFFVETTDEYFLIDVHCP